MIPGGNDWPGDQVGGGAGDLVHAYPIVGYAVGSEWGAWVRPSGKGVLVVGSLVVGTMVGTLLEGAIVGYEEVGVYVCIGGAVFLGTHGLEVGVMLGLELGLGEESQGGRLTPGGSVLPSGARVWRNGGRLTAGGSVLPGGAD